MAGDNAQVLRDLLAAWNANDMEAVRDLHDPDVVMQAPRGWPDSEIEVGQAAVMRQLERLRQAWDSDFAELVTDYVEVGDRVIVRFVWHASGRGPESSPEMTQVATVRNGKIVRIEYYWDHDEALEAAGLTAQEG